MDEPMKVHKRPHTSLEMSYTTVYIPKELKAKARLKGLNLSALLERAMHQELKDLVPLDEIKKILLKQCDNVSEELGKENYTKTDVYNGLALLKQAINKIEGEAYIKVGQ